MTARRVVVVGAGIAGLAAADALRRRAPALDVWLLEATARVGGLVGSERTAEGFLIEHGADCLVTSRPWGLDAARRLGLGAAIVAPSRRRRYVARGCRLRTLPPMFAGPSAASVLAVLATPLLAVRDKIRLAAEPWAPARRTPGDESIADFVTRRFGPGLLEAVVAPLVGGMHGADTRTLSLQACLPLLAELERSDGSVSRGLGRLRRERRRRAWRGDAAPPPMVSLRDGMGTLPAAFARTLPASRIRLGVAVRRAVRAGRGRLRLDTAAGELVCDGLVLAVPAWRACEIVAELDPDLASSLGSVSHTALDCVTLGWRREDVPHALDGTGFVCGAGEPRPTRACTWASRKWPHRAPMGQVLVRSVLAAPQATDRELVAAARRDLRDLLGIEAAPRLTRVRRIRHGTPIYRVGHGDRAARMHAHAAALGPVALAGNAYDGVGVSECVGSGARAAARVLTALAATPGRAARPDDEGGRR